MHLYSLSLRKATAATEAIYGNFSSPSAHEFVVSRGKALELLRPDEEGKLRSVCRRECYGVVRSIKAFRLTGGNIDYIVVGSDSGKVTVLKYDPKACAFEVAHCEVFGKTGCRRIVPGQFVAVDPKGRSIMVAALEKQKMVYVMNRDASTRLTISSPLEAHKSHTVVYDLCGCDVAFDNPVFAALEMGHNEADEDPSGEAAKEAEKTLTMYELDLGLNHVVRKWAEPTDRGANMVVAVPGGADGPGGVLVCAENWIIYRNMDEAQVEVRTPIPRRVDTAEERGVLIVASATHKQKGLFFFLLQSEYGDLYKVSVKYDDATGLVNDVLVKYFDTLPVANSLCITKTGLLFLAAEFGNHALYQFQSIGEDDDTVEARAIVDSGADLEVEAPVFAPRPLTNLEELDSLGSLAPCTGMQVAELAGEEVPQIYTMCGRGARSSLRVLRHGLQVGEMAVTELPGKPNAVWTVKESAEDEFDKYIVVSFVNATLVLSIGDTVEEVSDSGLDTSKPTLGIGLLDDDMGIVQVHQTGIRHVAKGRQAKEWPTPGKRSIEHAALNGRQVVVALDGGDLIYFELDHGGSLVEVEKTKLDVAVACLDMGAVPKGRQRCLHLAVGGVDNTVRILSLDPNKPLESVAIQALPAAPHSVCLLPDMSKGGGESTTAGLHLNIGLSNGVLVRTIVDRVKGTLSHTRTQFLGSRAVRCVRLALARSAMGEAEEEDGAEGAEGGGSAVAVLACSSRPWLVYEHQRRELVTPLSYTTLEHAANFTSEQCADGIVAISGSTMRILSLERLGEHFNSKAIPLGHTPRRFLVHPDPLSEGLKAMVVLEGDHNAMSAADMAAKKAADEATLDRLYPEGAAGRAEAKAAKAAKEASKYDAMEMEDEEDEDDEEELTDAQTGYPKPGASGRWVSALRVVNPNTEATLEVAELPPDTMGTSMAVAAFPGTSYQSERFLVVGAVKNMQLHPRSHKGGLLLVYRFLPGGKLQLLHSTEVDGVPLSMAAISGRLLVGVSNCIRIYDMGKKRLLRKTELRGLPTMANYLKVNGDRIYIGDMHESFHFAKYNKAANTIAVFADDTLPRMTTCGETLDYDTVVGGDKFGNLFVLRLPSDAGEDVVNPTGNKLWSQGQLSGVGAKLEQLCQFHNGEVVTGLQKTALVPGRAEAVLHCSIMGSIGALMPLPTRDDVDFFSHLELHMRAAMVGLVGRDHLSYRSYYVPVKNVIDGDLCEEYLVLPSEKQKKIAADLDRTVDEVVKKVEDMRNRLL